MKTYKSLNNKTVKEFKSEISRKLHRQEKNIRFIGSRIHGGYRKDSDLDVCILDRRINPEKPELFYIELFGISCEIHYVDGFDYSYFNEGYA